MNESIPDPTAQGLSIQTSPPTTYRDVFDYVLQHIDMEEVLDETASNKAWVVFVDTARRLFAENQPIGQDNLGQVLSLRFQDGLVLPFCDVPPGTTGMSGIGGAMPITQSQPPRGNDGKGTTVRSPSWGITGQ